MSATPDRAAGERADSVSIPRLLFGMLGAPVLWAFHLGVIYLVLTIDCISAWGGGSWGVGVATAVCAAASAWAGWVALSMYRGLGEERAGDDREWARFLLLLGIGASVLFTAVIVVEGVSPLFVPDCG